MRDMLGREEAVSVAAATELMNSHFIPREPAAVSLALEESYGRIVSEDVFSLEDLPAFPRSTVDGFAVKAADTFGATEGLPAYLDIKHEILMGEEPSFELKKGSAAKIATGGMLPAGADAVVMLEHAQHIDETMIEVLRPAAPCENVISAGEDVKKGELVIKKGGRLRPQDVAALAAIGITNARVYKMPVVSIISTGDEIVPVGSPVKPGRVRDINSYNLAGLVLENGGLPVRKGIFKDVHEEIMEVVRDSVDKSELVIITGGSSVGARDMTAGIINSLGSPGVLFHGVALKPGKPVIGAVVNGTPVFGLPGHPAAVTVCFEIFVKPVLKSLTGLCEAAWRKQGKSLKAKITRNISSAIGKEEHIRVALEEKDGEFLATPVLGKSGLIKTLVRAEGKIVLPVNSRGIQEGEIVDVSLF